MHCSAKEERKDRKDILYFLLCGNLVGAKHEVSLNQNKFQFVCFLHIYRNITHVTNQKHKAFNLETCKGQKIVTDGKQNLIRIPKPGSKNFSLIMTV